MGTTAQKINYAINATNDIAEGINDLGGEITQLTPLAQFREHLNSIWSNLPKVIATGNDISFQALRGRMDKTFRGDTSQETNIKTYTCTGTETGDYYFVYDSVNYQFTMPSVSSGDILAFNTDTLVLKLGDTTISTTTASTGTLITLANTPSPNYPMPIQVVKGKQKIKFNNRLPKEYTEVDYIESSGTQYIDTGRTSTPNTKFEMDYLSKKDNTTTFQNLLGAQNGTNRDRVYVLIGTNVSIQTQFPHSTDNPLYMQTDGTFSSTSKSTNFLWNQNARNKVILDLQNRSLTIGEYTSVSTSTYEITNSDRNIFILARNDSTISSDNFANGKLYSFKWYESNVLTMNLIPCYRNSDNEVGLYDLVNGVFYKNQGTGVFTYGSIVTEVKELDLKSKNLIPSDWVEKGGIYPNNGNNDNTKVNFRRRTKDYTKVESDTYYTMSYMVSKTILLSFFFYDENKSFINSTSYSSATATFTAITPSNCKYIRLEFATTTIADAQLEQGSTATSYEPYFDYELCKIDDYEDYFFKDYTLNKWYLHNEIGYWHLKDYTFSYISVTQGSLFRKTNLSKAKKEALLVYSPIYKGITTSETRYNNTIAYNPSSTQSLDIIDNRYTTSNNFNAYIQTLDDINDKVYCVLRETTDTEITSPTLIAQLEAIEAQRSIDGTNTITSQCEEGLPVRIGVTALMKQVS